MRWDKEKLPYPNLHMYGKNGIKIMVYDMKRCQKKKGLEKHIEKRLRNMTQKKELQILGYTIQATLRTIFISSTYNYPSKPSTIVTSFLKSS